MHKTSRDSWYESSTIPASVYDKLPAILQEIVEPMPNSRAKDVLLLSSLGAVGGVFTNVSGLYDGAKTYPTLYLFVVAPAASDKSVMLHAQSVVLPIHEYLRDESKKLIAIAMAEQKKNDSENAQIPKEVVLIIPGNTSASQLLYQLDSNNGQGIMFEEEADTIANSLAADWGNYSDLLRKAFHNGRLSIQRVGKKHVEVTEAKLSVIITGTPNQAPGIIKSIDDGLSSRFMYYVFEAEDEWRDVSPFAVKFDYNNYYNEIGTRILDLYKTIKNETFEFNWTAVQWKHSQKIFRKWLVEYPQMSSIIKRLGGIHFRISMLISYLRHLEDETLEKQIICSNIDYLLALNIVKVILEHDMLFMEALPKAVPIYNAKLKFLELMEPGQSYSKADLIGLAEGFAKQRTVTKYLVSLIKEGKVYKEKHGIYIKTE